jgi:DNA polymerase I-like protein with 3'-5' exonuclease and polymerase domains
MNTLLSVSYIKSLLKNPKITKIFHNATFDITWLEHIFDLEVVNYDDTMIMKFLLSQNEQERKSLKSLTKQYLDMGYYEYNIKQYVRDNEPYSNIPPKILMDYNNADTDATLRLWSILKSELKKYGLEDIHYNFMIPKLRGIVSMQKSGIAVDVERCMRMRADNEDRLVVLFSKLRELTQVANFERLTNMEFNPFSDKHKFAMVYGGEVTTDEEVPRRIVNGKKVGKKEKVKVIYNGFDLAPITISAKSTVTGKREQRKSFGKKAIQKYLKSIYKDVEYLDPINTFNLDPLPSDTDIMKFIKIVSEMGTIKTQLSNHIKPFIEVWGKTTDTCVHTSYDITGTTTGRLSCIAKGTLVEIVRDVSKFPKGVPNNKLCLKEVKWAGKTGYKKCVKINWRGQGSSKKGNIILTPEHKVRLLNGIWKEANLLKSGDRILSMSRGLRNGYSHIYCYNKKEIKDHRFIVNELKGISHNDIIHHRDGNKLKNTLDNLQIVSRAEHNSIHYSQLDQAEKDKRAKNIVEYDRTKIDWEKVGKNKILKNRPLKFSMLRLLSKCGGRLTTVYKNCSYDYNTLKRYLESYDINWREIRHRYGADGKFLSKGRINRVVNQLKTIPKVAKELRIGTDLAKFYIKRNNHIVISVEECDYYDVYNLEVADTHRFIANELCVKNSRSPNLQNLSRTGFVKKAFISRWGDDGILIEADYKQLELFIMAIVSQDPKFVHAFMNGIDLHLKTAANIVFHVPEDEVTKQMRTMAKTVNFGMIYGKTSFTLCDDLNVTEERAEEILQNYFKEYQGVKNYCEGVKSFARSTGYVTTVMGRRRYLDYSDPNGADRQAVNTTIQSPASDVCVTAVDQLRTYFKQVAQSMVRKIENDLNALSRYEKNEAAVVCGTVHDSIIVDCKRKYINQVVPATKLIMENTNLEWLTIPLKIDVKYGPNLRDMIEWTPGEEVIF